MDLIDRPPPPLTYILGVPLFAASAVLLTSVGGAGIAASPVTLSLMLLVVWRHPTRGFRIAGVVIGGLTAAEAGWGIAYGLGGERSVAIWLVPAVLALSTAFVFASMRKWRAPRAEQRP